jgi:polyhydroxybutyrate depolymerase
MRGDLVRWTAAAAAAGAASAVYRRFLYAKRSPEPDLSAPPVTGTLLVGKRHRTFTAVVPARLPAGAPLLIALHGASQDGGHFRAITGYGFDRLTGHEKVAVVYPNGYRGHWNDARKAAHYPARRENVDDESFVAALIEHFHVRYGIDRGRVFVAGFSGGGQLALRLAATMPDRLAGVAVLSANQPTPENLDCVPRNLPVPVLLMTGTADPINPFDGGEVTVFGFGSRGDVRSAPDTFAHFAAINGHTGAARTEFLPHNPHSGGELGTRVVRSSHRTPGHAPVELYTVFGGGHVVPNPDYTAPLISGHATHDVDAPAVIWAFFRDLPPRTP